MPTRILKDAKEAQQAAAAIQEVGYPCTVSWAKGAKRSLAQNATIHMWMGQIAGATGQTQAEVKAFCKWHLGRPILIETKPDWAAKYAPMWESLSYEMRLQLFEFLPVTSVMGVRQLSDFMDAMQQHYLPMGIPLVDPEARKYEGELA